MTVEAPLYRDPQAAALLKIGQAIQKQWIESDRQAAMEARAQAQKELERLQQQIA